MEENKAKQHADRQALRDRVLEMLNDLTKADPKAMHQLAEARAEVNDELQHVDTPATEAVILLTDPDQPPRLGIIGLINGILGLDYRVAGQYDDSGQLVSWTGYEPRPLEKRES